MKAGCILADVIIASKSVDKRALWQYQVQYYRLRGADHVGVDVLKRWLLGAKPDDLDWLFEKGVVDKKDMAAGATGKLITLKPKDLIVKVARGYTRLPLLLAMNSMLSRSQKASKTAKRIPETYDEKKIAKWEKKIEKLVRHP